MNAALTPAASRDTAPQNATRVAVVAALSATTMLFASLASAYVVRRSFGDWQAAPATWPMVLMAFAFAASGAIEIAAREKGQRRRLAFIGLTLASALYLSGAIAVMLSLASSASGLGSPFHAFAFLLLGVHALHAIMGGAFACWILRGPADPSEDALLLARLVTHFLTGLLFAIVLLLFGLQ